MNSSKRKRRCGGQNLVRDLVRRNFSSLSLVSAFSLYYFFPEAFLVDLTLPILSPQSLYDGVRLRLQNFPRIRWAIFLAGTRRCPKRVFHWSAAWPSWQPLWWGLISFQNLESKTWAFIFLHGFPCFKRINTGYRFDRFLWNFINAKKSVRLFWYSNTSFTRSRVTKIGKYSIRQLQNRFSRQAIGISKKPHTLL